MDQSLRAPGRLLRQYMVVTAAYWAFTLGDGALRMLVIFHFHGLGYSTLDIALLFIFYGFFGVLTNRRGAGSAPATACGSPSGAVCCCRWRPCSCWCRWRRVGPSCYRWST